MASGDRKKSLRRRFTALAVGASLVAVLAGVVPSQAAKVQGKIISTPLNASYPFPTFRVVILKGNTVKYTNVDTVKHNVNFVGLGWSAPYLGLNQSYTYSQAATLKRGTYPFKCDMHPTMTGQLIVK
jgi:plastocyanin